MFTTISDRGPVRWLTMSNPGRKNAVPLTGWAELTAAFEDFEESAQRALVVTGADGDFCSGADLATDGIRVGSVAERTERMRVVGSAALALHSISKPTLAAVDGIAAGAGMNLALGCDVVVATEGARFTEIFVKRGLTVDFGGTWLLPRLVGLQRAKELILSGRIVGAEEAARIGLVLDVVSATELADEAQKTAEAMADGAPLAQMFAKQTVDRAFELSFEQALDEENQGQVICMDTSDVVEGIRAFAEKRSPRFEGR